MHITQITPHIVVDDADRAAAWYVTAFGAVETTRIPVPGDRLMQVGLLFGDIPIYICDEFPEVGIVGPTTLGGDHGALHLATDDADALFERATSAGAEVLRPLADQFWGERMGQIRDPFGHRWSIAQRVRDIPAAEIAAAAWAAFGG